MGQGAKDAPFKKITRCGEVWAGCQGEEEEHRGEEQSARGFELSDLGQVIGSSGLICFTYKIGLNNRASL